MGAAESTPADPVPLGAEEHATPQTSRPAPPTTHSNREDQNAPRARYNHPNRAPFQTIRYELVVEIRGAERVGKTALHRRLCGHDVDCRQYVPSIDTEEAIIDWVYYSQHAKKDISVPVKVVDVVDTDTDDTEPSAVLILVSPYSPSSLEYLRRHVAAVSSELPLLIVYNFRDLIAEGELEPVVSLGDIQAAAEAIRRQRLEAKQLKLLQRQGNMSLSQATEVLSRMQSGDKAGDGHLSARGELLVNVLDASMKDCHGLMALQQYLEIPLRNKQRKQLEEKLKLVKSSLQAGHVNYEACKEKYGYVREEAVHGSVKSKGDTVNMKMRGDQSIGNDTGALYTVLNDKQTTEQPSKPVSSGITATTENKEKSRRDDGPRIADIKVASTEHLESFLADSSSDSEGDAEHGAGGEAAHTSDGSECKGVEGMQSGSDLRSGDTGEHTAEKELVKDSVSDGVTAELTGDGEYIKQTDKIDKRKNRDKSLNAKAEQKVKKEKVEARRVDKVIERPPSNHSAAMLAPTVTTYSRLKRPARRPAPAADTAVKPSDATGGLHRAHKDVKKDVIKDVNKVVKMRNTSGGDGTGDEQAVQGVAVASDQAGDDIVKPEENNVKANAEKKAENVTEHRAHSAEAVKSGVLAAEAVLHSDRSGETSGDIKVNKGDDKGDENGGHQIGQDKGRDTVGGDAEQGATGDTEPAPDEAERTEGPEADEKTDTRDSTSASGAEEHRTISEAGIDSDDSFDDHRVHSDGDDSRRDGGATTATHIAGEGADGSDRDVSTATPEAHSAHNPVTYASFSEDTAPMAATAHTAEDDDALVAGFKQDAVPDDFFNSDDD